MRNRDLLERFDRHLDQADHRWASIDRHLDQADRRWASIDRHLDQADHRWASLEEQIRLSREEAALSREQRERHAEMFVDMRHFTRDLMLRMERVTDEHVKVLRDLRQDGIAHRQALLRLLDRLGPGGSPPPA